MQQLKHIFNILIFLTISITTLFFYSCTHHDISKNNDKAQQHAIAFAEAFYNFDFQKAKKLCTKGSTTWLDMFVSNINKKDITDIKKLENMAKVESIGIKSDRIKNNHDSSIIIEVKVKDAYVMNDLAKLGQIIEEQDILIPLVIQDGEWKVKMEGLPQSEK